MDSNGLDPALVLLAAPVIALVGVVLGGVLQRWTARSEGARREARADERHQLDLRQTETRMFTDRFREAAAQIGNSEPAVRLAGVYAMAALADEWAEQRQPCVDVLCGYLRLPPRDQEGEDQVRLTIVGVMRDHLQASAAVSWSDLDFDFAGAHFPPDTDFGGATFSGGAGFEGATFSGGAWFDGATFSGTAGFGGATFRTAQFDKATFTGGAQFREATFGGRAEFGQASIAHASFDKAVFKAEAGFEGARVDREIDLGRAASPPTSVVFPDPRQDVGGLVVPPPRADPQAPDGPS